MRVLLLSPTMEVAGAERIVVALARHLAAGGHEVTVAAPPGPLDDELATAGVARRLLADRQRSRIGAARAAAAVAGAIRAGRPTVVHAHNPKMAAVAAAARRAVPGLAPPLLATFHGGDREDDPAAARLLRRADHLVCVEDGLRSRMVAHGCRPDRTEVIVNGVAPALAPDDPALARLDAELGLTGPVVAAVGTLHAGKAVDRIVRAAAIVTAAEPGARALVVGDGPERGALEALASSLGLGDRIRFLGVRRDAAALIQRADVVVSTSRSEGLSLAALEALGAGTPLVAPDVGGMRRLLGSGAGVLLADTEPGTVAAAVLAVLRSPDRGRAMGERGRALVAAHHGRGAMLDAYEALYADLARAAP